MASPFRRWFAPDQTPGQAVNKAAGDITRPGLTQGARTSSSAELAVAQAANLRLQRENQILQSGLAAGLTWTDPTVPFGPSVPAPPAYINPDRGDGSGRPQPRQYEYDISWNLPGAGQKLIPWRMLRDAADIDIVRALIEAKKAELVGLEWDVTIGKRALDNAIADDPNTPRSELERQMRDRLSPDIARACDFFATPDRDNGYEWDVWLALALEEMLVLDALAIYPAQTLGGLRALHVIDGSTIKPLLDQNGMRPTPPNPAFQQILYGFPRGDFTADASTGGMTADELIYRRTVVRSWTPYGYSAVERALETISTLIARDKWIRDEYSSDKPDTLIMPPDTSNVDINNYSQYEALLNGMLSGNAKAKRNLVLGIPGGKLEQVEHDAERYKPDYDLYLLKRLAVHFDMPITELGFSEAKGLGSAGFHEGQDDVNERRNILPWTQRLSSLCTGVMRRYLQTAPELEFKFLGLDDEDEAATDAVVEQRVRSGRMTLNEGRDRLGLPRYDFDESNEAFIATNRDVIFLSGLKERQEQQTELAQTQIEDAAAGQDPDAYNPDAPPADAATAAPAGAQNVPAKKAAKAAPAKKAAKKAAPVKAVSKADDARGRGSAP